MEIPENEIPSGPPEKVLAARIIALERKLAPALRDVSTEEEARALRLEHYTEEIRAWLDGSG